MSITISAVERHGDYAVELHQSSVRSDRFYTVVFDGVETIHTPAQGAILRSFHYLRNARMMARRLAKAAAR
jgi:hypothetical protein